MNLKKMKYLFLLMMSVFMLASCSEDDSTVDEYANWQQRNEKAFADTLDYAKQKGEANGWLVLRNWSLENQTPNKDAYGNDVQLTVTRMLTISSCMCWKGRGHHKSYHLRLSEGKLSWSLDRYGYLSRGLCVRSELQWLL